MPLNESIVEAAALAMPMAALTRPLPAGEEKERAGIRRLNPAIPETVRAGIRNFRIAQLTTQRTINP
jgi:hypothetical protein